MMFSITIFFCVLALPLSSPKDIVHPCDQPNKGGCGQVCDKVGYAKLCRCLHGFRLSSDGQSCEEHPCTMPEKGGCEQICVTEGHEYTCQCDAGYTLSDDGEHCEKEKDDPAVWDSAIHTGIINGIYNIGDTMEVMDFEADMDEEDSDEEDDEETGNGADELTSMFIKQTPKEETSDGVEDVKNSSEHPCDLSDKGDCEHICVKEGHQYSCQCEPGYRLADDGKSCENSNDNLASWESAATYGESNVGSDTDTTEKENNIKADTDTTEKEDTIKADTDTTEKEDNIEADTNTTEKDDNIEAYTNTSEKEVNIKADTDTTEKEVNVKADDTKKDFDEETVYIDHVEQSPDEISEHPCDLPDQGDCEHKCVKEGNQYSCECKTGYTLAEDGKSCPDPNEEPFVWQREEDGHFADDMENW